ncbi:MAG TPA: histidine kinase dimerization/phospho-acceptor domain-containing protein [Gemmatimonadaceae bacterium]|nr:histidine kinase dimerization/phospho-acceptor domain-containing protein [Gemmatimonadaceae bacterium]
MQTLADRAAHEIRNPLNGLAVNLEVVRSRAARGKGDLASIGRFADSASGELERAAELVQALLELARPLATPVDLWSALRPMVALHNAMAIAGAKVGADVGDDGATAAVTLEPRGDAVLTVAADPVVSRLALAAALDAAAKARTPAVVKCSIEAREVGEDDGVRGRDGQVVAMLRCAVPAPPLDDVVRDTIEGGDVVVEHSPDGMMLFFRAAGRD